MSAAVDCVDDDSDDVGVDLHSSYLFAKDREKMIAEEKAIPKEERFKRDKEEWDPFCKDRHEGYNTYDTSPLEAQLYAEMGDDPVAREALSIFLEANKSWEFIYYCVERLNAMSEINQQKLKEILMLIAPGVVSTRYMKKVVDLVGRVQEEVRARDMQYVAFCRDMIFHNAVKNARFGRVGMGDMFKDAFFALWPTDDAGKIDNESFDALEIIWTMYNGTCFDDWPDINYGIEDIYPNWHEK
jgi:hypothetical protein